MLLKNNTAIITGCNKGIGKVILETFAENGANIIACTRKETTEFNDYIGSIKNKYSISITPIYFDLENPDEIKIAISKIVSLKIKWQGLNLDL